MENGTIELCPLLSFFLMLPLLKPVSQAWVFVGCMCKDLKKVGQPVGGGTWAGDFVLVVT